jgi:hypothetical protein
MASAIGHMTLVLRAVLELGAESAATRTSIERQ